MQTLLPKRISWDCNTYYTTYKLGIDIHYIMSETLKPYIFQSNNANKYENNNKQSHESTEKHVYSVDHLQLTIVGGGKGG